MRGSEIVRFVPERIHSPTGKPRARGARLARVGLLLLFTAAPSLADTIVLVRGRSLSDIRVISASWDSVQYEQDKQVRTLSGDQVKRVERDSLLLGPVRRLVDSGRYGQALTRFRGFWNNARGWEKAEAGYSMGRVYLLMGEPRKAMKAFDDYLGAFREEKDWWVPYAIYGYGEAALLAGQGGTAKARFSEVAPFGQKWELKARLGEANALLVARNPGKARDIFRSITNNNRAPADLRQEAVVGGVRALLQQKQASRAIEELDAGFFGRVKAADLAYNESRAWATHLMGKAHSAQGGRANLESAELWFLKVTALYGTYPKVYREAAKELIDVYTKLGRADRAAEWRKRAAGSDPSSAGASKSSGKKNGKKSSRRNGKKNGKKNRSKNGKKKN